MNAYASVPGGGPASPAFLPEVTLRGDSYQRGLQYGRQFADQLEGFYHWFVCREPADLLTPEYRGVLEDMEQAAARHFPQLLEWVRGCSDGARLSSEKCRIMAFHNEIKNVLRPGCSNILVTQGGQGAWLGRNCDLFEAERPWQVRITCRADDCHSHAGVTYLGLPLGAGVNGAGLALGGASLPSLPPETLAGMPNLSAYLLWTRGSTEDCIRRVEALGFFGKGANLAILDADGAGAVLELGGGRRVVRRPGSEGFLVATNHSASGEIPAPPSLDPDRIENSRTRYARLTAILSEASPADRTPALGRRALADHEGAWPVCPSTAGGPQTIYSTVIRPGAEGSSRGWLCWGRPCERPYRPFALGSPAPKGEAGTE